MKLIVARHGEYDARQAEHPLSTYGEQQVDDVARQLVESDAVPDVIYYSPILRTQQTAERHRAVFSQFLGKEVPLLPLDWLHEDATPVRKNIRALQGQGGTILLVTHEPTIKTLSEVFGVSATEPPVHAQARVMEGDIQKLNMALRNTFFPQL